MVLTPKLPSRKNHRLKEYDYGSAGYYYVTLCTKNRDNLLSTIILSDTVGSDALVAPLLTELGSKVSDCWHNIARLNDNIEIDKFVIMPNHIHMILIFDDETAGASPRPTLMDVICAYKSLTTIECRRNGFKGKLFQNSFFEHIIRNLDDYQNIVKYIYENPTRWYYDKLYVEE